MTDEPLEVFTIEGVFDLIRKQLAERGITVVDEEFDTHPERPFGFKFRLDCTDEAFDAINPAEFVLPRNILLRPN